MNLENGVLFLCPVAGEAGGFQFGEHLVYFGGGDAFEVGMVFTGGRDGGDNLLVDQGFEAVEDALGTFLVAFDAGENFHAGHFVEGLPQ